MRLLLWALLATVVMLLSSTDAASTKLSSSATTEINSDVQVRALVAEYNSVGKRNLRGSELAADSGDDDEEERAFSVSSGVDRIKSSLQEIQRTTSNKLKKFLVRSFYHWLYWRGDTPLSLRAKTMGNPPSEVVANYKLWYDKVVAAHPKH